MPFKHLRVHPLRTGCPGQLDAQRYRWVFRFTLSFSVVLHRYQNKLKAKQKRSSGVKEVKEQLLTLTHSGVITWVIQEQLGCMPTFGDKQNRQGSNPDLFKLSELDGSHLGPKYLSYKHFSPKTSTASGALCLRSVLTSDLMSPFCSRRVCGRDLRHSVVMATESYVQPVHKPYITLCQGHRLCSTYKWVSPASQHTTAQQITTELAMLLTQVVNLMKG